MEKKYEKDKVNVSKVTKPLPCKLTEAEITKYGRDIARANANHESLVNEAKSVAKEYAGKIAEQNAIISTLWPRVHSGIETRPVECEVEMNWTHLTVKIRRMDTGELIEPCRPMKEEEKQMVLPGSGMAGDDKDVQ